MRKWFHQTLDQMVILLSALSRNRYFQESIESPDFRHHMQKTTVEVPAITGRGLYPVTGETLAGTQETNVLVRLWKGIDFPTIIYQHGNVERPFDLYPLRENLIERIFFPDPLHLPPYNLILIRSYLDGETQDHFQQMAHLSHFMAKLAFYCVLEEKIIQSFMPRKRRRKEKPVFILAGAGFGGTVVNLHRSFYNTADAYVPILAGADPGHVFTSSSYRRMTGRLARKQAYQVNLRLNFENDFLRVMTHNVYPLLAQFDQVAIFDHQKRAYETKPIFTIPRGHYSGLTDASGIRRHLVSVIEKVQPHREPAGQDRWTSG